MCGIIGIIGPHKEAQRVFDKLLYESSYRGVHQCGVTMLTPSGLVTRHYEAGADSEIITLETAASGYVYAIAHTRYSTSDLAFPQPIHKGGLSLVMNGVINQGNPHTWPFSPHGYQTRNDAEILVNQEINNAVPHIHCLAGSYAVCVLLKDGTIKAYRNGYRPLYFGRSGKTIAIVSTLDIMRRVGEFTDVDRVEAGTVYRASVNGVVKLHKAPFLDYQPMPFDPKDLKCKV